MGDSNKEEARTVFYASRTLLSSVGVLHEFLFLFPPGWNQAVFKLFTVQIFFSSPFEGQTASYRYGPSHCVSSFSPLVLGTNPNLVPICTDYSILEILLLHFGNALHLEKGPFRFSFFFFFFCNYWHFLSFSCQSPTHFSDFWHPLEEQEKWYLIFTVSNGWCLHPFLVTFK